MRCINRFRPRIEVLETRAVPATLQVNPADPTAFPTIQSAINAAQAGDTIKVTGAWAETNYFYNGTNTIVDLERGGITEAETFAGYVPGIQVHTGLANTTITHA